jgi:hypothetical protein
MADPIFVLVENTEEVRQLVEFQSQAVHKKLPVTKIAAKARDAGADVSALDLYGLTPEEIQLVEGATANKRQ